MSLKDELLKAKLISKKDVQRIEHEKRVERKKIGDEGIKEQENQRKNEIERKLQEQKQRDKELAKQQVQEKKEKEKNVPLIDLVQSSQMEERGNRKFYFVTKNNTILSLCISDNLGDKIERGNAGIIEIETSKVNSSAENQNIPTEVSTEFYIVNRACAEKILEINPNAVRFLNR